MHQDTTHAANDTPIKFRHSPKFFIALAIGMGVIFGLSAAAFALGYYPIAIVNRHVLFVRTLRQNKAAATAYAANFYKAYGANPRNAVAERPVEIEATVLQRLVEDEIIRQELAKRLGGDLSGLVSQKIEKYQNDKGLADASYQVFGLSPTDFAQKILIPEAQREILTGRLLLEDKDFGSWLVQARAQANVKIFSSSYSWVPAGVKIN